MPYMAGVIVPSHYEFIFLKGSEVPVIAKVREFLEDVVYLQAYRDVKMGNILIDSKGAAKLADITIFLMELLELLLERLLFMAFQLFQLIPPYNGFSSPRMDVDQYGNFSKLHPKRWQITRIFPPNQSCQTILPSAAPLLP